MVMASNHLILCCLLLLPSIFPNTRVFSNESALRIRWPNAIDKYFRLCKQLLNSAPTIVVQDSCKVWLCANKTLWKCSESDLVHGLYLPTPKSRLNPIHSIFFHIAHGWDAFHVHDISVKWQKGLVNVQPKHFNHPCALLRSFIALEEEGELYDVKNCCNWQKTGPKLA